MYINSLWKNGWILSKISCVVSEYIIMFTKEYIKSNRYIDLLYEIYLKGWNKANYLVSCISFNLIDQDCVAELCRDWLKNEQLVLLIFLFAIYPVHVLDQIFILKLSFLFFFPKHQNSIHRGRFDMILFKIYETFLPIKAPKIWLDFIKQT